MELTVVYTTEIIQLFLAVYDINLSDVTDTASSLNQTRHTVQLMWWMSVNSSEYKQKYDEIVKQNGILTIDNRVSRSHCHIK